jgi:hypothetical protein
MFSTLSIFCRYLASRWLIIVAVLIFAGLTIGPSYGQWIYHHNNFEVECNGEKATCPDDRGCGVDCTGATPVCVCEC